MNEIITINGKRMTIKDVISEYNLLKDKEKPMEEIILESNPVIYTFSQVSMKYSVKH